jgi:hypothetical protein
MDVEPTERKSWVIPLTERKSWVIPLVFIL